MTSVIPQIAGLNRILKMIDGKGGKEWFFDLYAERNRRIREGAEKLGLTMFPRSGYESPTVNCVNAPANLNGLEIYGKMREEGFELAKGYGSIKNVTFRIGNMGYIESEDIDSMLEALGKVLVDLGWKR
jgi:aspartate aminotransferase-like enzyme